MSDIGVETSTKIIASLRERIKKEKIQNEEDVKKALKEEMQKILDETDNNLDLSKKPTVILVVGVNGVGKTTSIGKIANRIKKEELCGGGCVAFHVLYLYVICGNANVFSK